MCTFFTRTAVIAVLVVGCSRHSAPAGPTRQPAPRADTLRIALPVIRLSTSDSANGSTQLDSATLALLERRVMSRVASMLRAGATHASGSESAGIVPVKNSAPEIRHGLLGTISFSEDGSMDASSRDRIAAITKMLKEIEAPLEIRATSQLGAHNIDVAIARARRVYVELVTLDQTLADRDVAFTIRGVNSLHPINPSVEIFWRESAAAAY
jgi:hypothetical protein